MKLRFLGGLAAVLALAAGPAFAQSGYTTDGKRIQATAIYDPTTGDVQSIGGGTQYTEDAAAAANPVGNALNLVRKDTPSASEVSADGDNVALKGTKYGAAYATLIDGSGNQPDFTDAADGAADAGPSAKIGGKCATSEPAIKTAADRVPALFDCFGRLITTPTIRSLKGVQHTTITASASETTIVTAAGVGIFADPYAIVLNNLSASAGTCTIKDDTAGTTIWVLTVAAGGHGGFARDANSATPQAVANKPWTATCTSLTSWDITVDYVKTKG